VYDWIDEPFGPMAVIVWPLLEQLPSPCAPIHGSISRNSVAPADWALEAN
jgi:hypothetical protein